jgi:hypothetical protein
MVFNRAEFVGLTVESAADNQRQLAKFGSKENDRRSRDLWWERSNVWAGTVITTGVVNTCNSQDLVKGVTFCGDRNVQIGQSVSTGGHQIHIHRKVVFGVAERFDALEAHAFGRIQK